MISRYPIVNHTKYRTLWAQRGDQRIPNASNYEVLYFTLGSTLYLGLWSGQADKVPYTPAGTGRGTLCGVKGGTSIDYYVYIFTKVRSHQISRLKT